VDVLRLLVGTGPVNDAGTAAFLALCAGVLLACALFAAWWWSPWQRSKRRREDARLRVAFRRELRRRRLPEDDPNPADQATGGTSTHGGDR
jgi:hypothetical protein